MLYRYNENECLNTDIIKTSTSKIKYIVKLLNNFFLFE